MQFSEMIFVGGFLPLFLAFSFITGIKQKACDNAFLQRENKGKNIVFLLFSLVFLLSQGLISLLILSALALYSFAVGKRIHKKGKAFFVLSLLVLLLPLLFFKYSIYLSALPIWIKGFMPFGISFYSFRFISYLSDCKEEGKAEENFFHFAIYAFAFPVLSQGPILRYKEMREEIYEREWNFARLSRALFRFSFGLWKKLILADALGKLSNSFLSLDMAKGISGSAVLPSFLAVFFSCLSFMLQIYLDFSAYTDMAIALGEMAGFSIPENFHYPYEARTIRDFWRRWHISLSLFFRDYIYIPLGGNRLSFGRRVVNLLLIWILTGIWHGASFNFILWGLYFFLLIVLELVGKKVIHLGRGFFLSFKAKQEEEKAMKDSEMQKEDSLIVKEDIAIEKTEEGSHMNKEKTERCNFFYFEGLKTLALHCYTLIMVYFSWILFRYQDLQAMKNVLKAHLFRNVQAFSDEKTLLLLRNHIFLILMAILFSTSFFKKLEEAWADLMMRGRIRKERKGKREEDGFYGMEESEEEVSEIAESKSIEEASEITESKSIEEASEIVEIKSIEEAPDMEELLSEEEHRRHLLALKKIQRKTKWRIFFLDHGERIYYLVKIVLALAALAISFSAMVGQSYTPFLYNQF